MALGNNDRAKPNIVTKDDEKTGENFEKGQWAPTGPVRNIPLFGGPEKGSNEGGHLDIGQSSEMGECGPIIEEGKGGTLLYFNSFQQLCW